MKAKRQRKLEECRRQLASIEKAQNTLEKKGVELEKQIRLQEEGTYATAITGGDGMTVIQWESLPYTYSFLFFSKDIEFADHLMEEWFAVVHEKNKLVKEEADVVYMSVSIPVLPCTLHFKQWSECTPPHRIRDLELIEQHDQLEMEIRVRLSKDGECIVQPG